MTMKPLNPVPSRSLEVTGLSVIREQAILREISWKVRSGEHWVILGANGSGKTTLLRTLLAYMAPTKGTICINGRVYGKSDWREIRKCLGLVSSHLIQRMDRAVSVPDVILSGSDALLNQFVKTTGNLKQKAMDILDRIGCAHLKNRNWLHCSQGEKQRLLIGRALMANLSFLILDEPCAGLDPPAREQFLAFIDRFGQTPDAPSLILVTHHVEEIMPVFTHVLLMKHGTVLNQGKKETMLNSGLLSEVYAAPIRLSRSRNRYRLRLTPDPEQIV